jgi:DNA repair exonuclease SbcCD ATPase subunit
MITFKKLRWKNFLSTGNIFTEIDLCKSTNTLIVGENGAGKSTILDAITYVLFGKPFRKVNKPQLVNTITRKDMMVEIEFAIGKIEYKIIRGQKPNFFEVYQNGNLINQSAEMRDYQEVLEKQVLKLNYKSFCQVVMLGSASFVPFMQLPAAQRREVIEDLLDLQIFTTMNSILKDKMQQNNGELVDIASDQKVVTEKMKLIQEHLKEKQSTNEKLIEEKKNLIEETNIKIEDIKVHTDLLKKEAEDLAAQTKDVEEVEKMIDKIGRMKHKLEASIAIYNNDIEFFSNHDDCPTCTQAISLELKNKQIENKTKDLDESKDKLLILKEKYEEHKNKIFEINRINNKVRDLVVEISKNNNHIDQLNKYINQMQREIDNINESHSVDEVEKFTALEEEMEQIALRYNEAMDQKQIYTVASHLLKDGGIKARIIKQYVPVINKLINKYLSALDFFVQFELDEEFNETIKSRFRDEFSYASFSEGEKMRINLAILFTWRAVARLRNSVSTNLLIMDEVFDSSLDTTGTEEFLKIIKNLTGDTNTFIISHKGDQLYDKFESVIKFEKKQNFSRIAT